MLTLYTFAQSSASYRVRIAMALKGVSWQSEVISLIAGDHQNDAYLAINPEGRVPALLTDEGLLTQSLAILDWLEDTYPKPSLYPESAFMRARCRAFAHVITTDIFPLQNLSTRKKLAADFGADDDHQAQWSAHWIASGFAALEAETAGRGWTPDQGYLFGDAPTLAEICLVPQMNNARRYKVDVTAFPLLVAADNRARAHPAFATTAPETQAG
jgi:maleylacetoacetate isomerase